jgi:alpha-ribazole phosphatase
MRHGPPVRPGLLLGHRDEAALDPGNGFLLERAGSLSVDRIVTSDLRRAHASAEIAACIRGLPLIVDPRWRELDFGMWDGLTPEDVPEGALSRFWSDPVACPPPEGESWSQIRERVGAAIATLSGPTLVMTHAGAMRAALSVLTGLDHRGVWALDLPYGALLSLRVWPGEPATGQVIGLQTEGLG